MLRIFLYIISALSVIIIVFLAIFVFFNEDAIASRRWPLNNIQILRDQHALAVGQSIIFDPDIKSLCVIPGGFDIAEHARELKEPTFTYSFTVVVERYNAFDKISLIKGGEIEFHLPGNELCTNEPQRLYISEHTQSANTYVIKEKYNGR